MNTLLFKKQNRTAIITLNRPDKHNALNDELITELTEQLNAVNQDETIKSLILHAEGKNFCAGADVNWLKKSIEYNFQQNKNDALTLALLLKKMSELTKPIITLTQGKSMGGALGLLAASDIVLASDDAQFCFSEVKLGLIPATIAPYVIRKIGFSAAQFYFLTAILFDAKEALHLNLIHRSVPAEQLLEAGLAIAEQLQANGPAALHACKKLTEILYPITEKHIDQTTEMLATIRASDEGQEGLKAFLEKRHPGWK